MTHDQPQIWMQAEVNIYKQTVPVFASKVPLNPHLKKTPLQYEQNTSKRIISSDENQKHAMGLFVTTTASF